MRNSAIQETIGLEGAVAAITGLLPDPWEVRVRSDLRAPQADGSDLVIELQAPPAESVRFEVVTNPVSAASIPDILRSTTAKRSLPPIYVSDYIGPKVRAALQNARISYADATGWVWVNQAAPLLCLSNQGAAKAPKSRTQPSIARLNGAASNRLIRALCSALPPMGVRELASEAGVAAGTVSKLLTTLAAEGVVERSARGRVLRVNRRDLIDRWVMDYAFAESNANTIWLLDPRGPDHAVNALTATDQAVFTGSVAARSYLPEAVPSVVPLRLVSAYTRDPKALAGRMGFVETEPYSANVVLATPQNDDLQEEASGSTIPLAPVPLVLADLLTLPGRGVAEPTQLMDELAVTDPLWKV